MNLYKQIEEDSKTNQISKIILKEIKDYSKKEENFWRSTPATSRLSRRIALHAIAAKEECRLFWDGCCSADW